MDKLYTAQEVADILHVKVVTVERDCKKGKLKAIKINRRWLISEQTLADYTRLDNIPE